MEPSRITSHNAAKGKYKEATCIERSRGDNAICHLEQGDLYGRNQMFIFNQETMKKPLDEVEQVEMIMAQIPSEALYGI